MLRQDEGTEHRGSGRLAWFVLGAVAGATVAILYAPRTGKDTRSAVADTGRDVAARSGHFIRRSRSFVEDAADLFERGRRLIQG